jgi:hypothetical protein
MSLSITQTPTLVSLAQSPMAFTLSESDANLRTSSSFQYVGELYYWQGSPYQSSSAANYTIVKYPNTSGVGIFDVSKIINSTLTDLAYTNTSNVMYYAVDFYWQWLNGTAYTSGSHVKSSTYKALDGYGLMGTDLISYPISSGSAFWPLMTAGAVTQSYLSTNGGYGGVYTGVSNTTQPTKITYTNSLGATGDFTLSTNVSSSGQIAQYPVGPTAAGFPISVTNALWYKVQAYASSTPVGNSVKYEYELTQKYENIRVMYKNRFGQFDYMNLYMQNRKSFNATKRNYQPQLGSWNASTLSYNTYDSNNKVYIVDANQMISANSNWLYEEQNEAIKQLLVSDEIYWVYDEQNNYVKPLNIITNNIQFKTGVNDHLIQYQFDFNYGQSFKLIF